MILDPKRSGPWWPDMGRPANMFMNRVAFAGTHLYHSVIEPMDMIQISQRLEHGSVTVFRRPWRRSAP